MDPNQTLADLRELSKFVGPNYWNEFAEKFQALDTWLQSGGFLPDAWDLAITKRPVEPARRDAIADHEEIWCQRCDRDDEHNFVEGKCLCCGKVKS